MSIDVLTGIIIDQGFPVAVTIYLLYERSKKYEKLEDIIKEDIQLTRELMSIIKNRGV